VNAIEVDARGLRCPLPVIRLAEAAKGARAGSRIVVLASDPAARHDIPAWCRLRGHELREMSQVSDPAYLRFVVVLRPQPPKAAGPGTAKARPSRST
jgi:tRNA 2-thiouridine synthesizing protein A